MGLFGRAWRGFKRWISAPPAAPPEPPTPPDEPDSPEPPERDLPPGWHFEGLYYGGRAPHERRVVNRDPTNYDIATADDVIVSYIDALGVVYKTVHGANSRSDVGDLILKTIVIVSPPR